MKITIQEAKKHAKENGIDLKYATRFLDVKVNKKPKVEAEAVVGIDRNYIVIFRKSLIEGVSMENLKIEIEKVKVSFDASVWKRITNQKSVQIQLRKDLITFSEKLEGEEELFFESLGIKFKANNEELNKKVYAFRKGYKKALVPVLIVGGILSLEIIKDYGVDLAEEYISELVKENTKEAIEENLDEIANQAAQKTTDSIFNRLNPFA